MADEHLNPGDGMHDFAIRQIHYFQHLNKKEREEKLHAAKDAQKKSDDKGGPTKDVVNATVKKTEENVAPKNAPSAETDAAPTPAK